MSYQSEKEEDRAFNSLSDEQQRDYFQHYRKTSDVRGSLDAVLGHRWFNRDGSPRGDRFGGKNNE